jgi:hypothetical protein
MYIFVYKLVALLTCHTILLQQQVAMSLEQANVYTCTHNVKSGPFHILVRTQSNDMLIELDTIGMFEKWRAQFKKVLVSLHGERGKLSLITVCYFLIQLTNAN